MTVRARAAATWLVVCTCVTAGCGGSDAPATPAPAPNPTPTRAPNPPPPVTAAPPPASGPAVESLREDLIEHFVLIQNGRPDVARVRLRKLVDADPNDGQAAFLFGLTYHVEKHYAKALPWFERAAEHAPRLAVAPYFQGWALYYLGRLDDARAAFLRHEGLAPGEYDTQFALGLVAYDEGRVDDAERRFGAALERVGDDPERAADRSKVLARRAQVFVARGEMERGLADLETACALHPDHYEAHFMLARLRRRMGDEVGAAAAEQAGVEAKERVGG